MKSMKKKRTEFDELHNKLDRVIDTMATKDDLAKVEKRLDRKIDDVIDAMATREDIVKLNTRIDEMEKKSEERFQQTMSAIDALTKASLDMRMEYAAINIQMNRHEEWIRQIAKKTGVKLT